MSDERDTTDMERLVSETYRAAATERAPEHLSEKILHAAAQESKKQPQLSTFGFAASSIEIEVDWPLAFAESLTVVAASRRAERIVQAPAAVTLLTREEVSRQSSHGQLPRLLAGTPCL